MVENGVVDEDVDRVMVVDVDVVVDVVVDVDVIGR